MYSRGKEVVNEEIKSIADAQFINFLGNKHVKTMEEIDSIIKPAEYKYVPSYRINLTVKYEKRNFLFNQIKPYKGEKLPKTIAPLRGIWEYNFETSDEMQKSEDSLIINESFEKETCPTCKGNSSWDCPKCDGDGKVNCENCNGHGYLICGRYDGDREIWCPHCDGTGKRLVYENGRERRRYCQYCNGTKRVICPSCDGKGTVICKKCKGNKTFECDECNGDGRICCNTCQGSSNILKYAEIKRESDVLKKTGFCFNSEIPDKLKRIIEKNEDFVDFLKETVSFDENSLNSFIKTQDKVIQNVLKDLVADANKGIPESSKIAKIEFSILICKTYSFNFSYSDEKYTYYSYNDKHFFEQDSVLNKIRAELNLYFYKKFDGEKNYVDAYDLLKEICKTKKSEKAKDLDLYKEKRKELKKKEEYRKQLKERKLALRKELKEKNLAFQRQVKEKELAEASKKSRTVALILCIFFGWLGVHRYYTGNGLTGFLQFLLSLCFGIGVIWAVVDLILIAVGGFKDKEKKYILRW